MTTIVWSTESVDTSATYLSQALDDTLFTKEAHEDRDAGDDITAALLDPENRVVFYGIVRMPEWFEAMYDNNRMFNDPRNARALLRRNEVLDMLRGAGHPAARYFRVREDTNYTNIRERVGSRRFDLVVKAGMTVATTVENAGQFNEAKAGIDFACSHIAHSAKYRVYVGAPGLTNGGIIGATFSEKRRLSFQETVAYGSSAEVRQHLEKLFADGTLAENMGRGQEAWTEQRFLAVEDWQDENTLDQFRTIAQRVIEAYNIDFCSVDGVLMNDGRVCVTNVTASPSLQNEDVLHAVSGYFNELLDTGREITKDNLLDMVREMSDEDAAELGRLLMGRRAA